MTQTLAIALVLGGVLTAPGSGDCPSAIATDAPFAHLLALAESLTERGCRPAARDLAEHLVGRAEADYGPTSSEVADVLDFLAETLFWLGDRDEAAIGVARRALAIRLDHTDRAALARSHRNLGALLGSRLDDPARVAEAFEHYESARKLWEETLGHESPEIADLMTWIAELLDDWGPEGDVRARQLPWIRELLDLRAVPGRRVGELLASLSPRGSASRLADDPALAVALHGVVLARAADAESPTYAECLNTLGNLLHHRQRYDEALAVFDECLEVRLGVLPPGHPQIARAYHNRGEALLLVGNLDAARPDLERGYEMRLALTAGRYSGVVSSSLRLLGRLFFFTGDLRSAVALYRDALPGLRETYGEGHWRYAEGLASLAEAWAELRDVDQATRNYREALEVLARTVSPEGARKAATEAKLGILLAEAGDLGEGERLLLSAQAIQESLPDPPLLDSARTLSGLAEIAVARGEAARALDLYRQAVATLDRYEGVPPALIDTLLETAAAELDLADAGAGATLARAESLLSRLGPAAYAAQGRYHLLRARWLAGSGDRREALAAAVEAAGLSTRHLLPASRVLPPDLALLYKEQHRASLDLALSLLRESVSDPRAVAGAWQAVTLDRGLVTRELEERYAWARTADSRLEPLRVKLDEARLSLARSQVYASRVSTLEEQERLLRWAEARLRAAERAFADQVARARPESTAAEPSLDEILAVLPPGGALIAYVRFGTGPEMRYGAFAAGAGSAAPRFVDLGPAEDVDRLVESWRATLLNPDPDGDWAAAESRLRRVGLELRRRLWGSVAPPPERVDRVFVVPAGALFLVPFAALPGRDAGTYLVEEGYELHRLVSERDLFRHRVRAPLPTTLLAVGGPDFNAEPGGGPGRVELARSSWTERLRGTTSELFQSFLRDPCLGRDRPFFLPLPEAPREADDVVALFRQAGPEARITELMAARATESAFKRLAPGNEVLHVATHGFFDLECRGTPASRGLGGPAADTAPEDAVPGLAFAGANFHHEASSNDDGILTVPEIAALDLSRVDWVVLSACETGIGWTTSGEGVLGLARSFRVAGAETLILSLWSVDDLATRQWMKELYRARFADGRSTAAAVESASRAMIARRRQESLPTHPYFWGAFVAMGGWDESRGD